MEMLQPGPRATRNLSPPAKRGTHLLSRQQGALRKPFLLPGNRILGIAYDAPFVWA
jgi:hypothetical protein